MSRSFPHCGPHSVPESYRQLRVHALQSRRKRRTDGLVEPGENSLHRQEPFGAGKRPDVGLRAGAEQRLARVSASNGYKTIGFVHLGRYEDALAALDPTRITIGVMQDVIFMPYYDPIRSDPRFVNFLATVGMTEAHARAQVWRAAHPPEKSVIT